MSDFQYQNGLATVNGIEFTINGYQLVDSVSIHLFLQNDEHQTTLYMAANTTNINDVVCESVEEILIMLGNPSVIN